MCEKPRWHNSLALVKGQPINPLPLPPVPLLANKHTPGMSASLRPPDHEWIGPDFHDLAKAMIDPPWAVTSASSPMYTLRPSGDTCTTGDK